MNKFLLTLIATGMLSSFSVNAANDAELDICLNLHMCRELGVECCSRDQLYIPHFDSSEDAPSGFFEDRQISNIQNNVRAELVSYLNTHLAPYGFDTTDVEKLIDQRIKKAEYVHTSDPSLVKAFFSKKTKKYVFRYNKLEELHDMIYNFYCPRLEKKAKTAFEQKLSNIQDEAISDIMNELTKLLNGLPNRYKVDSNDITKIRAGLDKRIKEAQYEYTFDTNSVGSFIVTPEAKWGFRYNNVNELRSIIFNTFLKRTSILPLILN